MTYQQQGVYRQWRKVYNPQDSDKIIFAGSFSDGLNIPDARLREYHGVSEEYTDRRYDIDSLYLIDVSAGSMDTSDTDYYIDTSQTYPLVF